MSIDSNLVECLVADSTKLPEDRPDLVESFDKVLLDGPCSALGQRPQLSNTMKMKELLSFPKIQKKLFHAAVRLLKSGGSLVYSTCTITRGKPGSMFEFGAILIKYNFFRGKESEDIAWAIDGNSLQALGIFVLLKRKSCRALLRELNKALMSTDILLDTYSYGLG